MLEEEGKQNNLVQIYFVGKKEPTEEIKFAFQVSFLTIQCFSKFLHLQIDDILIPFLDGKGTFWERITSQNH